MIETEMITNTSAITDVETLIGRIVAGMAGDRIIATNTGKAIATTDDIVITGAILLTGSTTRKGGGDTQMDANDRSTQKKNSSFEIFQLDLRAFKLNRL